MHNTINSSKRSILSIGKMTTDKLQKFKEDFFLTLRDPKLGKDRIKKALSNPEQNLHQYLALWLAISKESQFVYPSQGLLFTPYDYLTYSSLQMLPQETLVKTLRLRRFFLEMFNHPYRLHYLAIANRQKFIPPPQLKSPVFSHAAKSGISLSIGDLGVNVTGSDKPRTSRTERYAQGPFIKLGKYARSVFVGSSSPDVWNSAPAIATMAASHCLTAIPRNGTTSSVQRQADLAHETFTWLKNIANEILSKRTDKAKVIKLWQHNVMGTLEANPEKAFVRAKALYQAGVRTFRVYSPEPGIEPITTTLALRKKYQNKIEIFTGQITDVAQAQKAESAGANGIFIGIGGGGRCITGVRSGSVINWPELVWNLRGQIKIPVIVEGGASDHVAVSLLLGASAISVSRAVSGGTLESPGGALYCVGKSGKLFKPYGGEASARTKYLDGKLLPFNIPSLVEGETTSAEMSYVKHLYPTLTYNLHYLFEDAILAMVFRNANSISELHSINPSPLRRSTSFDFFQRNTH